MPTTCEINFTNNPRKAFFTGQLLNGTVRLTLTKKKTVHGIYVEVYGNAFTHWTERHPQTHNGKLTFVTKSYSAKEDYLCERNYFVGDSEDRIELMQGTYNHTFECMLPAQLPTSVNGEHGWIQYGARVVLHYPVWSNKEFNETFTVFKLLDLNVLPQMRDQIISANAQKFNACGFLFCWKSGPLRIVTRTPVGGYAPGQIIDLTVNLFNECDDPVSHVEARLIKHTIFYARLNGFGIRQEKHSKNCIAGEDGRGCNENQSQEIHIYLTVPPTSPTDCSTSQIIVVQYYIVVSARIDGFFGKHVAVNFPITIGTHPIRVDAIVQQSINQMLPIQTQLPPLAPQMPSSSRDVYNSFTENAPTAPPNHISSQYSTGQNSFNIDPPTYEEAMAQYGH